MRVEYVRFLVMVVKVCWFKSTTLSSMMAAHRSLATNLKKKKSQAIIRVRERLDRKTGERPN